MKTKSRILILVVALALEVGVVHAGNHIQYFVGYGIYPPDEVFTPDTSSTTPGTGLLAVNGSHRALIQLIWTGTNNVPDAMDFDNFLRGYAGGDDVVLDSRIIQVGVDGVDEWGYTSTPPPPFVSTNSVPILVFVRVHQGADPRHGYWYFDSPLAQPADLSSDVSDPIGDAMATVIILETGSEAVPTTGVALDRAFIFISDPLWSPDSPGVQKIQFVEFNPETSGLSCPIPYSYSFSSAYGADMVLPGGGWNWQPLEEGSDYVVANGVVTFATTGEGRPVRRMIRLGLIHNF